MKTIYYLSFLLILALAACNDKGSPSCAITIQVLPPEGYPTLALNEMEVTLTNKSLGTTYTSPCSSAGLASFGVEHGYYTAAVFYQSSSGLLFSARLESLPLLPEQGETAGMVSMQLVRSTTHSLVIKEIYYSGCTDQQGKAYVADQYVTLYNNSDATIYLDGLCVGVVDPSNSTESPWMKHTDMQRIPVNDLTWQFPGNGKEHPLHPGAETTLATNAVNHTGGEYQHKNSVDLSKVDWGFFDESLDGQTIEAGVAAMNLIAKLNPSTWKYAFPVIGPAFMVFSLQGTTAETYVGNPANLAPRPYANNQNKRYLMIPREWVIDCIDCVEGVGQLPFKRVPNGLDNGAAYLSTGIYSGKSLIRKRTVRPDGRAIYQDTNNSTQDLEVSEPTLKKK